MALQLILFHLKNGYKSDMNAQFGVLKEAISRIFRGVDTLISDSKVMRIIELNLSEEARSSPLGRRSFLHLESTRETIKRWYLCSSDQALSGFFDEKLPTSFFSFLKNLDEFHVSFPLEIEENYIKIKAGSLPFPTTISKAVARNELQKLTEGNISHLIQLTFAELKGVSTERVDLEAYLPMVKKWTECYFDLLWILPADLPDL